jgi:hypothetical protein
MRNSTARDSKAILRFKAAVEGKAMASISLPVSSSILSCNLGNVLMP